VPLYAALSKMFVITTLAWHCILEQESPAVADKPTRRQRMPKMAPIRRAYNVVADNTVYLHSFS